MLGAIAGDIIGSVYEGRKHWLTARTSDFQPLFAPKARFTDDTILTVAVADALLHGADLTELLKDYYARYPGAGFGGEFKRWAASDDSKPYGSWGNGSAMRVSPVAWAFSTFDEVLHRAKDTARVTHSHPEGIKGAQATAAAIFLAGSGAAKWDLRDEVERRFHYDLSFSLDDIRPTYVFDSSCAGTVPPAIVAFLESSDFESAVRLAVSLGGDCDTLACIAGGIAAAFYGVPVHIREQALARLDDPLSKILAEFERRYPAAARQVGPDAAGEPTRDIPCPGS
jgi:ADP-ribosylglycohydrolase